MVTGVGFVDALMESWNSGDPGRVASHYAEDYVGVDVAESAPQCGRAAICRALARYRAAFPDLRFNATAIVTERDRLALFWEARGTHRGTLMHIPATGRAIEVRGVSLLRVESGQITEALYLWDVAGLLRTVGLLPDLAVEPEDVSDASARREQRTGE